LSWLASTGTGVAGYRVYYGSSSRSYLQAYGSGVAVGSGTSFSVTGLAAGKTYYFSVTAVDSAGTESSYSNEASKFVQ
jgi:fibronectin type 3 domain-containing protein